MNLVGNKVRDIVLKVQYLEWRYKNIIIPEYIHSNVLKQREGKEIE